MLIASCNGRQKLATTQAEAEDTLGIADEENFEAKPLTAQELAARHMMSQELDDKARQEISLAIASADTADLQYFFSPFEGDNTDPALYAVMQRVMKVDVTYDGPHFFAHLWACEDAVSNYLKKYWQAKHPNVTDNDTTIYNLILKELHPILEHYGSSAYQSDMNTVALTEATLTTYKTIATFKDMMALCQHPDTRKAYFLDFAFWYDAYLATCDRHYDHYSLWHMETSYYQQEMMNLRRRFLQEEMRLSRSFHAKSHSLHEKEQSRHKNQPATTCVPGVSADGSITHIDWDTEDADLLRPWYDLRMAQAPNISHDLDSTLYRKITDRITSTLLSTLHFNTFMYEDNSDPSTDNNIINVIE